MDNGQLSILNYPFSILTSHHPKIRDLIPISERKGPHGTEDLRVP